MIPVVVFVSDPFLHLLRPFAYLFNIYWSEQQPVVVAGYTPPAVLPANFGWHQIDKRPYGKQEYSNGVRKFLQEYKETHFVLLLEDYFLTRTVDHRGINSLADYCRDHPDILRCDLTTDRLYNGKMKDQWEGWGHYDILESPHGSEYQFSFQAGIWNRDLLLRLVEPNKTPWEMEIHTSPPENMRVIGTRQNPVRYANIMLKGEVQDHEVERIPQPHRDRVKGWLKR